MKRILNGMVKTMDTVKPPRITALQDLHDAEDRGPFSILIGTIPVSYTHLTLPTKA